MNAIHALSQLSYDPIFICGSYKRTTEQELTLAKSASSVKIQSSFTFELRLAFFQKSTHTFLHIFCRKTKCKEVDLTSKPFVQVRS